jgi:hypothetical protein
MTSLAAIGGLAVGALLLVSPLSALAHESREVADGKYQMVVGFMNEPVYAGDKSGLEFWVYDLSGAAATPAAESSDGDDDEAAGPPVEGLDETLKAEVIYEDQTLELPLSAKWNDPGGYYSVFFPTSAAGDYSFRIYGTINGTDIDETFTSGPETFGPVEDPAPLQFPKP